MHSIQYFLIFFLLFSLILSKVHPYSCMAGTKSNTLTAPFLSTIDTGVTIRVLWTILDFHLSKQATLSEQEAKAMLFKPLDMTTSSITFDGQSCKDIRFTNVTVDIQSYLKKQFQTSPQDLGLEEKTAQVVKTNCRIPGFSEYILLNDRRLIVPMHGVLFVFEPAVQY